ncbi:MAG TPA: PP2C family protein-serine/threonine phosphatase [Actinocrinis sp.]|nr:PP2C family protein-serine/threonine phosphatase [Actinocrinis sp.]
MERGGTRLESCPCRPDLQRQSGGDFWRAWGSTFTAIDWGPRSLNPRRDACAATVADATRSCPAYPSTACATPTKPGCRKTRSRNSSKTNAWGPLHHRHRHRRPLQPHHPQHDRQPADQSRNPLLEIRHRLRRAHPHHRRPGRPTVPPHAQRWSILMGAEPTRIRPHHTQSLPPGSIVLLYTDGLIERRGEDLALGMARLRRHAAALAREPLETFCDELLSGLAATSTDDVALIAVRVPPPGQGPATATAE